jgi:hypothetical protein
MGAWDRALEIWQWHVDAAALEPDVNCPNVRGGPPLGAMLLAWRGDLDRALELVPIGDAPPDRETMLDRAILARYAILAGRNDVAAGIVESMWADPDRLTLPDGIDYYIEALADLNRLDALEDLLPSVRKMAGTVVLLDPVADRAEAVIALSRGDVPEARQLLERAAVRFEELSAPFELAQTQERLADILEEPRRSELLSQALAAYEQLRAVPFIERVNTSLDRTSG